MGDKLKPLSGKQNTYDKALDIILDYTASSCWEDVQDLDWTTAELQEVLVKCIESIKS